MTSAAEGRPMGLDLNSRLTVSVEDAAIAYGISRAAAYRAANEYLNTDGAEGIPAIRIGHRIVCPTAAIRRELGLAS